MAALHDAQAELKQLGIKLSITGAPATAYVTATQTGDQILLSGHITKKDGKSWVGKFGADVAMEQGKVTARAIAIDLIAMLNTHLGDDLSRIKRIVRVMSLVNSTQEFIERYLVTNGASELLVEVFSDVDKHARSAFGVVQISFGACVRIELITEVA